MVRSMKTQGCTENEVNHQWIKHEDSSSSPGSPRSVCVLWWLFSPSEHFHWPQWTRPRPAAETTRPQAPTDTHQNTQTQLVESLVTWEVNELFFFSHLHICTWLALRMFTSSSKTVPRFLSKKPSHSYCTWKEKKNLHYKYTSMNHEFDIHVPGSLRKGRWWTVGKPIHRLTTVLMKWMQSVCDLHHSPCQRSAERWRRCLTCGVSGSAAGACCSGVGRTASAPSSRLSLWASGDYKTITSHGDFCAKLLYSIHEIIQIIRLWMQHFV